MDTLISNATVHTEAYILSLDCCLFVLFIHGTVSINQHRHFEKRINVKHRGLICLFRTNTTETN